MGENTRAIILHGDATFYSGFISPSFHMYIKRSVIENLLSYARGLHPRESILLLRGKVTNDGVFITDTVIPPFATHGRSFSTLPLHALPIDFSIVGVAHSHPSGVLAPSTNDLNQFYGRIMVIVAFPYLSEQNIKVFDREGKTLQFKVGDDQ